MAAHGITAKNIGALAGTDHPEGWGTSAALRRLITRLEARVLEWYNYHSTVSELTGLSDRELADIGIPRSEIRAVARAAARSYGA